MLAGALFLAVRGRRTLLQLGAGWSKVTIGSACTLASQFLALWVMTQASVAAVAALRETSVVFAALFAAVFLKAAMAETPSP